MACKISLTEKIFKRKGKKYESKKPDFLICEVMSWA